MEMKKPLCLHPSLKKAVLGAAYVAVSSSPFSALQCPKINKQLYLYVLRGQHAHSSV